MTLRLGILSTAHINRLVIAGARESDRVEVTAVGSRDLSRAEAYAREWGIERAHGSYDELLTDPDVDAVYNPLPNSMHVDWSIRALEAGKHVLCEKPLSRRPDDVERAFDVADREGRILTEAFMYRHNPQTARLKELVDGGTIGELRVVRAAFSFTIDDPANIRLAADLDGGRADGRRLLLRQRLAAARGRAGARVRHERGRGGSRHGVCGDDGAPRRRVRPVRLRLSATRCGTSSRSVGTEGSIFLDDPWHCRKPVIEVRREAGVEEIALEPVDSYRLELENLADAAEGKAEPLLGRDDAVAQARAIDALYRSAGTRAQAVSV